jgi:hypothetical protein
MVNNVTSPAPNTYNYPMNGATSAVTINILNPATYPNSTVYSNPQAPQQPVSSDAQTQPLQQQAQLPGQYPYNYNNQFNPVINNSNNASPLPIQQTEAAKDKKVVPLTDEYIKSLESGLNDKNPRTRLTAANEILNRFKEDDGRKQDPALTALLNKALQDPTQSVKFLALTILDVGYAQGDGNTIKVLQQLEQDKTDEYGENKLLASQILLKLGAKTTQETQPKTHNTTT